METGIFSCPQISLLRRPQAVFTKKNPRNDVVSSCLQPHPNFGFSSFYKIPFFLIRFLSLFLISSLSACSLLSRVSHSGISFFSSQAFSMADLIDRCYFCVCVCSFSIIYHISDLSFLAFLVTKVCSFTIFFNYKV